MPGRGGLALVANNTTELCKTTSNALSSGIRFQPYDKFNGLLVDLSEQASSTTCFSGFDPPLMAQGSQTIRESSSVPGEGNSLVR
jgi:hypothetical protein